jgi:hypothetical protein
MVPPLEVILLNAHICPPGAQRRIWQLTFIFVILERSEGSGS